MKKILLTIGICAVSILGVQAQKTIVSTQLTFDQRVNKMLTTLTTNCNLTPDQVTAAKPIIEDAVRVSIANKQQYASDKTKLKAANQANRAARDSKLSAILNADQQAKLTALEQKNQALAQQKRIAAAAKKQQQ